MAKQYAFITQPAKGYEAGTNQCQTVMPGSIAVHRNWPDGTGRIATVFHGRDGEYIAKEWAKANDIVLLRIPSDWDSGILAEVLAAMRGDTSSFEVVE